MHLLQSCHRPSVAPGANYTVAIATSNTAAARTTPNGVRIVRVTPTVACTIYLNAAAVTGSGVFIPAGWVEYFGLMPGDIINVIGATTGTLYVSEMNG